MRWVTVTGILGVAAGAALLAWTGSLATASLTSDVWVPTGTMSNAREDHTATLLADGRVLVAGGRNGGYLTSAEVYDSANGTWTDTGDMPFGGFGQTATLLPSGMVLVTGGCCNFNPASAALYDPVTNSWSTTASMHTGRVRHTATLLPDGEVLVAGGGNTTSAELYEPAVGTWTMTGSMALGRSEFVAVLLPDGRVLVAGGASGAHTSAELYDPAEGTWTATGSMNTPRTSHSATVLGTGRVLVTGGNGPHPPSAFHASAEVYDPSTGVWTTTGSMATPRRVHAATRLPSGKVLVAGGTVPGETNTPASESTELYDPVGGTWTATASMGTERAVFTTVLLPNGRVLATGGSGPAGTRASAELYGPSSTPTPTATPAPPIGPSDSPTPMPSGGLPIAVGGSAGLIDRTGDDGAPSPIAPASVVAGLVMLATGRLWAVRIRSGHTTDN